MLASFFDFIYIVEGDHNAIKNPEVKMDCGR